MGDRMILQSTDVIKEVVSTIDDAKDELRRLSLEVGLTFHVFPSEKENKRTDLMVSDLQ